ncbi:zinc ribbon domain-containing protein [Nocardioides sp. BGMRC 2183]|nr:zinc ribbon domain-containing protein [Nocardioides sp. BGMRC 2183]
MSQRFCGHCGSPVDHRFCGECGAPTGLQAADPTAPSAEEAAPAAPDPDAQPTAVLPTVEPPTVAPAAPPSAAPTSAPTEPPTTPPTTPPPTAPTEPPTEPPATAPTTAPSATTPAGAGGRRRAESPVAASPTALVVRDTVLDVVAVVTLFVSLALPWNLDSGQIVEANEHWWVVLSVLLACAGVAVPYLGLLGVRQVTPPLSLLIKAGACVPLALSVFFVLLFEMINIAEPLEGGVGTGVVGAVFGLVLVLLPRRYDDFPALHPRARLIATVLYLAAAGLVVLTFVGELIRFVIEDGFDQPLPGWYVLLGLAASALASVVLTAVPAVLAARRPTVWTPMLATLVGCYLFVALAGSGAADSSGTPEQPTFLSVLVEKLSHSFDGWLVPIPVASGTFLLAAAVAFALGPWGRTPAEPREEAERWVETAVATARFCAFLLVASVLLNVVAMVLAGISDHFDVDVSGTWVVAMVMLSAAAALAFVVATTTGAVTSTGAATASLRMPVLLALGWFFVGLVTTVVVSAAEIDFGGSVAMTAMTVLETFLVLGVPLLVAGALTIPRGIRSCYEPLIPAHLLAAQPGQPGQPSPPVPPSGPPPSGPPPSGPPPSGPPPTSGPPPPPPSAPSAPPTTPPNEPPPAPPYQG